jgi:uncharacterized SAM-binding protein YcdF (DUF218 family)
MWPAIKFLFAPGSLSALLLILAAGGVVAFVGSARLKRIGRLWIAAWCAGYLVLSIPAISQLLQEGLSSDYPPITSASQTLGATAIVVLAAGSEVYDFAGTDVPIMNQATTLRVQEAARLYSMMASPLMVISGTDSIRLREESANAVSMRQGLIDRGVPANRVVAEMTSVDTYGSARAVSRLLSERQIDRIVLVTSAQHLPRAMQAYEAARINAIGAPAPARSRGRSGGLRAAVPSFAALQASAASLHEYVGSIYYRWRGWI